MAKLPSLTVEVIKELWRKQFNYIQMPSDEYIQEYLELHDFHRELSVDKIVDLLHDKVLSEGNSWVVE